MPGPDKIGAKVPSGLARAQQVGMRLSMLAPKPDVLEHMREAAAEREAFIKSLADRTFDVSPPPPNPTPDLMRDLIEVAEQQANAIQALLELQAAESNTNRRRAIFNGACSLIAAVAAVAAVIVGILALA